MDFATIERKLFATVPGHGEAQDEDSSSVATRYYSVDEWIADVHVVFQNSYIFNGPDHPVSVMAATLQNVFEKQLKKLPSGDETLSVRVHCSARLYGPILHYFDTFVTCFPVEYN